MLNLILSVNTNSYNLANIEVLQTEALGF